MKNILTFSAVALTVAALSSAATVARAETFIVNENFDAVAAGSEAGVLFSSPLTVAFAGFDVPTQLFIPDFNDPQLTVEAGGGGNVLGTGDGESNDGPIIFELFGDVAFQSFTIDVVPGTSDEASATAEGFFQTLTGQRTAFTVNQIAGGTLNLTSLLPTNTYAIILPRDASYDNVALVAVTVPEAGTLPLALGGLAAIGGVGIVRRRRK